MTTEEKWAAFVRAEPAGFVFGETCCCAFAMRWAARVMGGNVPGAEILESVRGKSTSQAWEALGSMGGMTKAVESVLRAEGWQRVETPRNHAIVVFYCAGHDSAGVWMNGKVISKTAGTGGLSVVNEPKLKGIFVWE